MIIHASCAARQGAGVLLLGSPGSGKSDLLLRLLDRGFDLVADDQVVLEHGVASSPRRLAGLMEIRGLGIVRMPHVESASLALAVVLDRGERMPEPQVRFGVPVAWVEPMAASAAARVEAALRCALGQQELLVGAFA